MSKTLISPASASAQTAPVVTPGTAQPVCAPIVPSSNTTHTAKALDAWVARYPSSTPQPVCAPVVANTQPSTGSTASTNNPILTLAWCNAWLQFTCAHELAELATAGAYVQARAVRAPGERLSPRSSVLLSVKDGLCDGEAGLDGELTFTFWDLDHPSVELGALTMPQFQAMASRFWQALPDIKAVYQARADYIAATGASPAQAMPDVEDQAAQADSMHCHWFTGDTLPKMDETQHHYPLSKLVALVNTYDQWADVGV